MERFNFSDSERAAVNKLLRSLVDASIGVPEAQRDPSRESIDQLAAAAFPSSAAELNRLISRLGDAVAIGVRAGGEVATRCGGDCMSTCAEPGTYDPGGCGDCHANCATNCTGSCEIHYRV
jgi:hypothetical protein